LRQNGGVEFYRQPKEEDLSVRKRRIVETAAKFILNDIKSVPTNKEMYPDPNTLSSGGLPLADF
jgi:hypothetical protein